MFCLRSASKHRKIYPRQGFEPREFLFEQIADVVSLQAVFATLAL
jgi:hypothetical protein